MIGKKGKIIHVVYKGRLAGAENLACALVSDHISRGYESEILSIQHSDSSFVERILAMQYNRPTIIDLPQAKSTLHRIICLARYFMKQKDVVIVTHTIMPAFFVRVALFFTRHKIISVLHGIDDYQFRPWGFFEHILKFRTSKTVHVSLLGALDYKKRFGILPEVVFNGINVDEFANPVLKKDQVRAILNISTNSKIILQVGRIEGTKGQDFTVSSLLPLLEEDENVHIVFAGLIEDAAFHSKILLGISEKTLRQIHFLGSFNDIPSLINTSDIFVMPSLRESSGLAFLEAYAGNLPIVATKIPAFAEFDQHLGVRLVDMGNAYEFRHSVEAFLHNKMSYERDVEEFDIMNMLQKYTEIIDGVLRHE
ncbi:glycosyltransferase family 4 protein [Deinococcus sp. ME38]|uniref:glycosyltransferase family 4 protein n=1 Tax=Deinococcus sp. ME38 TaxID=3400344 RepID=UPI003B5A3003